MLLRLVVAAGGIVFGVTCVAIFFTDSFNSAGALKILSVSLPMVRRRAGEMVSR
jgi:hypothetical protein